MMIKKFKEYFQDKKVFITGHTGFKGSWLTKWLLNLDANIIGFSIDVPTQPSLFEILNLDSNIVHIKGDIRNYGKLSDSLVENNPDIIIHLAAQPLVRRSYLEPVETYETNVMGTVNLMESVRYLNKIHGNDNKFLLNVTTDKCYENKEKNYAYKEDDSLGGYDPYSSSKACSELITSAYRNSFFNSESNNGSKTFISTARAGNIIGGGDWSEDRLVVDCVNSLVNDETIVLRNPTALRPWQHVLEGISGYLALIAHMINDSEEKDNMGSNINNYIGSWNFGPHEKDIFNVEAVVKTLIEFWGTGNYCIKSDNIFHEANLLKLDINKALSYLEWKPTLNFEESIKMTVDWYKNYYFDNPDMTEFTNKQINSYIKKQD